MGVFTLTIPWLVDLNVLFAQCVNVAFLLRTFV
jgi:hypothetical protein